MQQGLCHQNRALTGCCRTISQVLFALVGSPWSRPWPSILNVYSLILVMSQNSSKFRRWNYADHIIRLKNHNFPVQDIRKSRIALSMFFIVFTGLTILRMHQGNRVIPLSLSVWFGVEEVYSTTSPEEAGATSGWVMQEEVQRRERYYHRWAFLPDNPTGEQGGSAFLEAWLPACFQVGAWISRRYKDGPP